MDLKPLPIFVPPWVARKLTEANLEIVKITSLSYLKERLSPIDIASIYAFNNIVLKTFSRFRPLENINPLDEYWRDNETALFSELVVKNIDYGQARVDVFVNSSEIYCDLKNRKGVINHEYMTLPVGNGDGIVLLIIYDPTILRNDLEIDKLTIEFFEEFIKYNGVQRGNGSGFRSIVQTREIWGRYLNILERR